MTQVVLTEEAAQHIEEALRHATMLIDGKPTCQHSFGVCFCKEAAALTTIRAARAQEQAGQEPVAVVKRQVGNSLVVHITGNVSAGDLLYTAPVRTKDLTDEEIVELIEKHWDLQRSLPDFARAVIAKLREKERQK